MLRQQLKLSPAATCQIGLNVSNVPGNIGNWMAQRDCQGVYRGIVMVQYVMVVYEKNRSFKFLLDIAWELRLLRPYIQAN